MNQFNFNDITRPLKKYWALIVFMLSTVLLTVFLLSVFTIPKYQAKATLSFSEGVETQNQLLSMPALLRQKYLIKNQVAVLKSRRLAAKVIDDLQKSAQKDSLNIIGGFIYNRPELLKYKFFPWLPDEKQEIKHYSAKRLISRFKKRTDVISGRDTDLIELIGKFSSPWEAAFVINRWVEVYQKYYYSRNLQQVSRQTKILESELHIYQDNLIVSERKLSQYQRENQVFSLTSETEQLIIQLSNFESEYNSSQIELKAVTDQLVFLKGQLDEAQLEFINSISHITSSNLEELQKQYAKTIREHTEQNALLEGAGYDTEHNENLLEKERRITALYNKIIMEKNKLGKNLGQIDPFEYSKGVKTKMLELETSRHALEAKVDFQKDIIANYKNRVAKLPQKSRELAKLKRDVSRNSQVCNLLSAQLDELKISEAGEMGTIEVVDFAQPDLLPVSPKIKINMILGGFFGLIFGIALAFARDFLANTINDDTSLRKFGIEIIGRIPIMDKSNLLSLIPGQKNDEDRLRAKSIFKSLIIRNQPHASVEEAYRSLRTAIYLKNRDMPVHTMLVTSPEPGEGKSTTAANIAISLAQQNVRTLLVDTDIRRPVLDYLFTGSSRELGLLNSLSGEIKWVDAIRETSVNKLYVLPAGRNIKNGPELLSSHAMQKFIIAARQKFRFVIFDSPPVLPVTDATIIASLVEGIILVARNGKTTLNNIGLCVDILKETKTPIFGAVITGIKQQTVYSSYNRTYKYPEFNK